MESPDRITRPGGARGRRPAPSPSTTQNVLEVEYTKPMRCRARWTIEDDDGLEEGPWTDEMPTNVSLETLAIVAKRDWIGRGYLEAELHQKVAAL